MSTFYILPPREVLESSLGDVLTRFLPGLPLPVDSWDIIAEKLASAASWPEDVFLIPRDDLPDSDSVSESLIDGFGAEVGDRAIEIGMRTGPSVWTIGPPSMSANAAAR